MQKGRAPSLDGVLTEMLKLGGAEFGCRLKTIVEGIWRREMLPSDWTKHCSYPSTRREVLLPVTTIVVWLS